MRKPYQKVKNHKQIKIDTEKNKFKHAFIILIINCCVPNKWVNIYDKIHENIWSIQYIFISNKLLWIWIQSQ